MNGDLTDEAIEEGRLAILNLERELKERANDTASVSSNKHHSSTTDERRILDQMPREARLSNREESLGLTVEELDDRGLLDGGGSVPSYVTSLKNKSRRTLELQSRSHRLQGRDKETFTKLLNSFLHMIRTLVRKGLNLDVYCRRHDPNRRGLMRKKAFFTMLKTIGLPFTGRELQDITLHYMVPASDQADYVSLLKDARIVNLGAISNAAYDQEQSQLLQDDAGADDAAKSVTNTEPDTGISSPAHGNDHENEQGPVRGNMELSVHTLVLADVRRMLLESIRSLSKDQDDVYRMFARWDTQGTGTVTATQFLRVLARLHVDISDQDQDFLVELLDTNGMGRIDFEGLIAFCFASTPETDILSPTHLSGGGSLTEDNVNNETMSAVSTEGNTSVDKSYTNGSSNGINSRRPRTATLSRPYNEIMSHAHTTAHNTMYQHNPHTQYYQPAGADNAHNSQQQRGNHTQRSAAQRTPNKTTLQRPLTASGRVGTGSDRALSPSSTAQQLQGGRYFPGGLGSEKHIKTQSLVMEYGHSDRGAGSARDDRNTNTANKKATNTSSNNPVPRGPTRATNTNNANALKPVVRPSNRTTSGPEGEDSQYVVELPDDVMYGEEKYLGSDSARVRPAGVYNTSGAGSGGNRDRGGADSSNNNYAQAQYVNSHETTPNNNIFTGNNTNTDNRYFNPSHPRGDSPSMEMQELHEMGSFNDNTLVTDQEEYFFGSPKEIPMLNNTRNLMNSMNNMNIGGSSGGGGGNGNVGMHNWASQGSSEHTNNDYGRNSRDYSSNNTSGVGRVWREPDTHMMSKSGSNSNMNTNQQPYAQYDNNNNNYSQPYPNNNNMYTTNPNNTNYNTNNTRPSTSHPNSNTNNTNNSTSEPIEHLSLLATQILSTLREIIMGRYRRGRSLQEIFEHFDRAEKGFFDVRDFVTATADLRIETSPRVASIAVNLIAIDGHDKVSFAEFKVFVLDSDHKLLELNVQEQLAQMLEQKGREYQSFMVDMFYSEEESLNDNTNSPAHSEFVSKIAFVSTLQRIGLVLTSSELSRLVDRFDISGNEVCSVVRFVRMVQNSRAWRHAEKVLAYQDEALEEGDYLRQQLHSLHNNPNNNTSPNTLPQLPEELISMCEYLGIRVLSEPSMVWIAADALKAPLPVSWTAQRDSNGRTYFYNHLTNQTKLEHPLDPHFRKLRDKYRQGGSNDAEHDNAHSRHTSTLPSALNTTANPNNNPNNTNTNNTAHTTKSPNSAISFGGIGAALNPAPLNQSLVGSARPQPPANSFQHLYAHANGEHHFPAIGGGGGGGGNNNNVSPSMQMAQDEDEVLYVKYGNMGPGNGGNANTNLKSGVGSGYGQQQAQNTSSTQQPLPRAGSRRPQSALDRTQYSTQQQNQQAHLQQAQQQQHSQQQQGPRGQASTPPPGATLNTTSNTTTALPQGVSTGIYSAELRALMGSAAYNRPVSAPQNHHVQAEKLNAYTDASNRMGGSKQEEHKKNTMELLEAVYTNYPKPLSRHNTSSNTNSNSNMNTMNTISSNINGGGMGGRSGSAKWSNNNAASNTSPNAPTTTHTPLSVVDRAMSIGRSSNHAYQPSRTEQQVYSSYNPNNNNNTQYNNTNPHYNSNTQYNNPTSNNNTHYTPNTNPATNPNMHAQPRERSRSANRASSHRAPLDSHTKQARLSEMYDEAILEKLDNAIGIRR